MEKTVETPVWEDFTLATHTDPVDTCSACNAVMSPPNNLITLPPVEDDDE